MHFDLQELNIDSKEQTSKLSKKDKQPYAVERSLEEINIRRSICNQQYGTFKNKKRFLLNSIFNITSFLAYEIVNEFIYDAIFHQWHKHMNLHETNTRLIIEHKENRFYRRSLIVLSAALGIEFIITTFQVSKKNKKIFSMLASLIQISNIIPLIFLHKGTHNYIFHQILNNISIFLTFIHNYNTYSHVRSQKFLLFLNSSLLTILMCRQFYTHYFFFKYENPFHKDNRLSYFYENYNSFDLNKSLKSKPDIMHLKTISSLSNSNDLSSFIFNISNRAIVGIICFNTFFFPIIGTKNTYTKFLINSMSSIIMMGALNLHYFNNKRKLKNYYSNSVSSQDNDSINKIKNAIQIDKAAIFCLYINTMTDLIDSRRKIKFLMGFMGYTISNVFQFLIISSDYFNVLNDYSILVKQKKNQIGIVNYETIMRNKEVIPYIFNSLSLFLVVWELFFHGIFGGILSIILKNAFNYTNILMSYVDSSDELKKKLNYVFNMVFLVNIILSNKKFYQLHIKSLGEVTLQGITNFFLL